MNLVKQIQEWQDIASAITPPNENIKGAKGRHLGIVFFPEGLGLQNPKREASHEPWPDILVIGHNFGTLKSLEDLKGCGEERKPTWGNFSKLLGEIEKKHPTDRPLMNRCFMTNWFVGFPLKQRGEFLADHSCTEHCSPPLICPHRKYVELCRNLLIAQIRTLQPRVILLLGAHVIRRVHAIAPHDSTLRAWKNASKDSFFRCIDIIGPVAFNVYVPEADIHTNLVALVHPSEQRNHAHRGHPPPGTAKKGIEFQERMKKGRDYEKAKILDGIEKACVP